MTAPQSLLANEDDARTFFQTFVLPLGGARIIQPTARNKYADGVLSRSTIILGRDMVLADEEQKFIQALQRISLLADHGMYTDNNRQEHNKSHATVISPEWIVVYLTAFPLDVEDASDDFVAKVLSRRREQRIQLEKENYKDQQKAVKPWSDLASLLHQNPMKKHRLVKLDVDTKDPELISRLRSVVVDNECQVVVAVETRGGYHVVMYRDRAFPKVYDFACTANEDLPKKDHWVTIETGSPLIAIPGTRQAGFVVRLATEEWKPAAL